MCAELGKHRLYGAEDEGELLGGELEAGGGGGGGGVGASGAGKVAVLDAAGEAVDFVAEGGEGADAEDAMAVCGLASETGGAGPARAGDGERVGLAARFRSWGAGGVFEPEVSVVTRGLARGLSARRAWELGGGGSGVRGAAKLRRGAKLLYG